MFSLMDLPFPRDALGESMSAETLSVDHGKHHAAYVRKTNELIGEDTGALEDVVRAAWAAKDTPLFNNAAQVWNHGFFWMSLSPARLDAPNGALGEALEKRYGAFAGFRDDFIKQGSAHFASGWIWLVADEEGAVDLVTVPNAETPIVDARRQPILVCDLWEHAYYLDHKNERPKYLASFIDQLANWTFASRQYESARGGAPGWTYPLSE